MERKTRTKTRTFFRLDVMFWRDVPSPIKCSSMSFGVSSLGCRKSSCSGIESTAAVAGPSPISCSTSRRSVLVLGALYAELSIVLGRYELIVLVVQTAVLVGLR